MYGKKAPECPILKICRTFAKTLLGKIVFNEKRCTAYLWHKKGLHDYPLA